MPGREIDQIRAEQDDAECAVRIANLAVHGGALMGPRIQPGQKWRCESSVANDKCPYSALYDGHTVSRIDDQKTTVPGCQRRAAVAVRSGPDYLKGIAAIVEELGTQS